MKKIYYPEISFMRAIACLIVVLTHMTLAYPVTAYDSPTLFNMLVNQLARIGTPIFALISGLLLFNSVKGKKLDIRRFFKSRINKVVIPYFIWTLIYLFLGTVTHTHPFNVDKILQYIFLGEGYVHLYFMVVVIQFYLLFPLFARFVNQRNILWLTIGATILMALWYIFRHSAPFETLYHRAFIMNWIGYFFMGGYMAYHMESLKALSKKYFGNLVILSLIAVLAMLIEMKLPALFQSDRMLNIIYVPIFTMLFLGIYHMKASSTWKNMLTYIGDRSMGIYLVHLLVIGALGNIFTSSFWQADFMALHYFMVVVGTLLIVEVISLMPHGDRIIPVVNKTGSHRFEIFRLDPNHSLFEYVKGNNKKKSMR